MIWEFLLNRNNIKCDEVLKACLEYKLKEFHRKEKRKIYIFECCYRYNITLWYKRKL